MVGGRGMRVRVLEWKFCVRPGAAQESSISGYISILPGWMGLFFLVVHITRREGYLSVNLSCSIGGIRRIAINGMKWNRIGRQIKWK